MMLWWRKDYKTQSKGTLTVKWSSLKRAMLISSRWSRSYTQCCVEILILLQSKGKKDVDHFKRMSVGMAANYGNQQGKSQKHRISRSG